MVGDRSSWIKSTLMYLLLGGIAIAMLLPLLWMVSTAFKAPTEDIFQFPPQFIPSSPTFENFKAAWESAPFGRYFWNSLVIAIATVVLNLILCSLAAYPLARLNFKGREIYLLPCRRHHSDSLSDCDDSAIYLRRADGIA